MAREPRVLPGGGSGLGLLVAMRARRPAGLVGTVSHRPFLGLPGEAGMARGTRALPGVAAAWGPLVAMRASRPAGSGRDGVSPSVPWVAGRGGDGPRDSGRTEGCGDKTGRWALGKIVSAGLEGSGPELVGFRCSDPGFETWKGDGFGFQSVDEHVVAQKFLERVVLGDGWGGVGGG